MRWFASVAAFFGLATSAVALEPVEAYGNKFFNKDGSQFFMKGVAYQLRPDDPLIDTKQCERDAKLMKDLGANTIRIYHVDSDADHDGCMKAFADAGIYTLIDLDTFNTYILPENLFWNETQYHRYGQVMDTFSVYDNVLGFFIGNENIAEKDDSPAAPYLKAAARDMKAYRDARNHRKIPIGYSAADIKELRPMVQDYLTCGGNSSEIIDFFGVNSYSWCDPSSYEKSTYDKLQKYAKDFPVPIFFSETGCIKPGPRIWEDQDAIFSEPMVNDWSGAIVYEWIEEKNHYGLITYGPPVDDDTIKNEEIFDGYTRKGEPMPKSPDFDNLKSKWATISPSGVSKGDYDPGHVSTRPCPKPTGEWWEVDGDVPIPTLGQEYIATVTSQPRPTRSREEGSSGDSSDDDSDDSDSDSDGDGDGDGESASPRDKQITLAGAALASLVLGFALVL